MTHLASTNTFNQTIAEISINSISDGGHAAGEALHGMHNSHGRFLTVKYVH